MAFVTLRKAWENDLVAGYALGRKMRGISGVWNSKDDYRLLFYVIQWAIIRVQICLSTYDSFRTPT